MGSIDAGDDGRTIGPAAVETAAADVTFDLAANSSLNEAISQQESVEG
jgi:hypothetical protein